MASNTCKKRALQTESDDDLEQTPNFVFKGNETFARFLVIKSMEEKAVTSLSPFIIEKQVESIIGSPKSVKKLKKQNSPCRNKQEITDGKSFKNNYFLWFKSFCHGTSKFKFL